MAICKRKPGIQKELFVFADELPAVAGHPFYSKVNEILGKNGFGRFAQEKCAIFYPAQLGLPGLPPGDYFRLMMIGYFEGIDSERGIAWRVADSLALPQFLGLSLTANTPNHSTISKTRRLIDLETHHEVFSWVLELLAREKILVGRTFGIDATTLEANAAMRGIIRRDAGETYSEFLFSLIMRKLYRKGTSRGWGDIFIQIFIRFLLFFRWILGNFSEIHVLPKTSAIP